MSEAAISEGLKEHVSFALAEAFRDVFNMQGEPNWLVMARVAITAYREHEDARLPSDDPSTASEPGGDADALRHAYAAYNASCIAQGYDADQVGFFSGDERRSQARESFDAACRAYARAVIAGAQPYTASDDIVAYLQELAGDSGAFMSQRLRQAATESRQAARHRTRTRTALRRVRTRRRRQCHCASVSAGSNRDSES